MKMLDPGVSLLRLKNPMSSDQSVMRSNLFPGLVQAALSNKSRQQESIRLFELGSVFELRNENLVQSEVLSGIFWGYSETESWSSETRNIDFYDVKGCVDHIINLVGFAGLTYQRTKKAILHPGQGADIFIDEDCVGYFGKLHPELCADFEINDLFVFELEADFVRSKERRVFSTFSKFPSVRRDISVLVDRSTEVIEVKKIAEEVLGDILVSSTIFDVYEGKGVSESQKSIGLGLTLQSQKATLKEQEINDLAARTVKALQDKLGATLR